jgi:hypothetical protein
MPDRILTHPILPLLLGAVQKEQWHLYNRHARVSSAGIHSFNLLDSR